MCDASCQYTILISDWVSHGMPITATWHQAISCLEGYSHDEDKIWRMANAKVESALPSKILEIKNNPPEPTNIVLVLNLDAFLNLENSPEEFYEHYQNLAPTRKEQEQRLEEINTRLCDHCLILYIMPEHVHDMDAGFGLRYPGKEAIKLEPHLCIYIDLKVALEILATTMIQLASRSSLAKRGINIREGIIDAGYVGNIITMLQNDSKKAYIIEPNKKIAQAIFLPLVKIAQLVSVGNREELGITARRIQGFRSMSRIDVPVNMAEEKIVSQREFISTSQAISIPPYDQYMVEIERKMKDQNQIFEAETSLYESGEIGLINLYIPAKEYSRIKISIYNNTGSVVQILEETTIGYLTTEIED
ncbi:hypothetical protein G9A89_004440 [Geosiphon pyriformis]|nr:hypothetical protein G9A89_004440 [Geosiphon pyriformis]